jgi:hypothetical protein
MHCQACQSPARKNGRDRRGNQRYRCLTCSKRFAERPARPLGDMRLPVDRALLKDVQADEIWGVRPLQGEDKGAARDRGPGGGRRLLLHRP